MSEELKKPKCVGIIIDGNRRWARERGLPTLRGHQIGIDKLTEAADWCVEQNIPEIIYFVLSIENWKRSEEEVSYLMDLLRIFIKNKISELHKKQIKVNFIGDLSLAPQDIKDLIIKAQAEKIENPKLQATLAFSYGGRREILNAVKKVISTKNKEEIDNLTEEEFSKFLWTGEKNLSDPDIIIRTSGEMRLSGFLPWQGVYAELFFTKTLWPDFSYDEFKKILEEFSLRERRIGR